MARILIEKGTAPDLIISSPAKRAYTTATYFAKEAGIAIENIQVEEAIYEASSSDVLSVIENLDNDLHTVFVFGHNPTFTHLINIFLNGYLDNLPTTGIGEIKFAIDEWKDISPKKVISTNVYYPKQFQQ